MHVATTLRRYKGKEYKTRLVRRTFREDGKVKHETIANVTGLPDHVIAGLERLLSGVDLVEAGTEFEVERSLGHGNVAAVLGTMRRLGIANILCSRPGPERARVEAMIAARILHPDSKIATTRWWPDTTLPDALSLGSVTEDDLYAAMDWLLVRQETIQKKLAANRLSEKGLVLYDLSSSYFEGRTCPLAKLGHSRDDKKHSLQVEYGLLTDAEGCPVAIEVFEGNTADAKTVMQQVERVRETFGIREFVLVGDRGMITKTRIEDIKSMEGVGWITALKAVSIQQLYRKGAFQLSLFDERNLAVIEHPDYPGERLVVCRNPFLAEERRRKREELLLATEKHLTAIQARVQAGRLKGADKIGLAVGKVINKHKMSKHIHLTIEETDFAFRRKTEVIDAEAALDGIYVIRASAHSKLSAEDTVRAYKKLADVEQAFRCIKTTDLEVRPICHRLADRVRAHIFLCMLAYHVEWHMRRALAPLLYGEEDLVTARAKRDPVAPAPKSAETAHKTRRHRDADGNPLNRFGDLLEHLSSLRQDRCRYTSMPGNLTFTKMTRSTSLQRKAFELLGVHP